MYKKIPKTALVALLFSISAFFLIHQNQKIAAQQNVAELTGIGSTLSQQMAFIAGPLILSEDWVSLNVALKQLTENPFILSADIINPKDEVLAQVGRQSGQQFKHLIGSEKNTLGTVRLYLDQETLSASVSATAKTLSAIIFASHFLLFILIALLYRKQSSSSSEETDEHTEQKKLSQPDTQPSHVIDITIDDVANNDIDEKNSNTAETQSYHLLESTLEQSHESLTLANTATEISTPENSATTNAETAKNDIRYFVIFINCRQGSGHLLEEDARKELLKLYQQLFERVCEIYRGTFSEDTNGNWLAQFPQKLLKEQEADLQMKIHCGSNALCAALLFKSLYRKLNQQRILQMKPVLNLKIGLVAGENPENLKIEACEITNITESNEVIASGDLYAFEPLRQLLMDEGVVTRAEQGSYLVHQLAKDFQQLIDRQAEHFLQTSKEEQV